MLDATHTVPGPLDHSARATLAVLEFGAPLLAWGALAAAIPVVIHLVLRPRTRQQILPTLRFLRTAHQTTNRMHRLKRFILLATRMLILALIALLLMRPTWRRSAAAVQASTLGLPDGPVSAVLVFDTSPSMGFRKQGQALLAWSAQQAREILGDPRLFPPGSQVALVSGSKKTQSMGWMEAGAAAKRAATLTIEDVDIGCTRLLEQACTLVTKGKYPAREIYLFSDLSRHAFTGTFPPAPPELKALCVVDVGAEDGANAALAPLQLPGRSLPADLPLEISARLDASRADWSGQILVEVDGTPRSTQDAGRIEAGTRRDIALHVPPLSPGVHRLSVRLSPGDALPCDDQRFGVLVTAASPTITLITGDPPGEVPQLLAAMIAPPALPQQQHRFALRVRGIDSLTRDLLAGQTWVILADIAAITEPHWRLLQAYANAGGSLLTIPGPAVSATGYALGGDVLPAIPQSVQPLDNPMTLAAAELSHPYLAPFRTEDVDSINARPAIQRLLLGPPQPGARTIAPFADGRPALLERRIGAGRSVLLAFSPHRDWGEFGTQAGPFLVLLQTILSDAAPAPQGIAAYRAGQAVAFTTTQPAAEISIRPETGPPLAVPVFTGRAVLPTDRAGAFRVSHDATSNTPLLTYSVDIAPEESDLTRIPDAELLAKLPPLRSRIVRNLDELNRVRAPGATGWSLLVPVLLLAIALMWFESVFSNRFFGTRQPAPRPAGAGGTQPFPELAGFEKPSESA